MLAVASMIASVTSPVLFCLCLPTIVLSLTGVIGGHISLYRIARSKGQMVGTWAGVMALCFGYPVLLISCVMMPGYVSSVYEGVRKGANADEASQATESVFDRAESNILTSVDGAAHGNSPEAIVLATEYSSTIKELRELLFTKRERGFSLSQGKFVTHCELHEGKCCFLVHVPDYRKFDDDAKKSLETIAWLAAQKTVAGKLKEGDQLAVGLKRVILYGSVQIGEVVAADKGDDGVKIKTKEKELLHPFFEEPEPLMLEPAPLPSDNTGPEVPTSGTPDP